ncbi:MAG: nuclear transport factor 2 family protein [Proteobacteria bacterium]|nr:nuclear transport factor 2 family protein [Pseudomonadota bacterium]HQR03066.1 nuclear transport factor 2 family protein [Rhodocyclaceae bacterium]
MIKIDLNAPHPAQRASFVSPQMVKEKNKAAWLALFAENAVIQDPVGPSPLDPTGKGHQGKEAISRFWDMVIGDGNFDFTIHQSYPCGDECANVWIGTNALPGGIRFETPMVTIYKVDAAGKILSLRAFWDSEKVAADLKKVTGA